MIKMSLLLFFIFLNSFTISAYAQDKFILCTNEMGCSVSCRGDEIQCEQVCDDCELHNLTLKFTRRVCIPSGRMNISCRKQRMEVYCRNNNCLVETTMISSITQEGGSTSSNTQEGGFSATWKAATVVSVASVSIVIGAVIIIFWCFLRRDSKFFSKKNSRSPSINVQHASFQNKGNDRVQLNMNSDVTKTEEHDYAYITYRDGTRDHLETNYISNDNQSKEQEKHSKKHFNDIGVNANIDTNLSASSYTCLKYPKDRETVNADAREKPITSESFIQDNRVEITENKKSAYMHLQHETANPFPIDKEEKGATDDETPELTDMFLKNNKKSTEPIQRENENEDDNAYAYTHVEIKKNSGLVEDKARPDHLEFDEKSEEYSHLNRSLNANINSIDSGYGKIEFP